MKKLAYTTPSVFVQVMKEEIVRTSGAGEEVGTSWSWIEGYSGN